MMVAIEVLFPTCILAKSDYITIYKLCHNEKKINQEMPFVIIRRNIYIYIYNFIGN